MNLMTLNKSKIVEETGMQEFSTFWEINKKVRKTQEKWFFYLI